MGMYVSNNKVVQKLPDLISTIGDLPEETRVVITPYGNKYKILNFGYQYSNPLILPLDVTVDFIVYGNITLSSTIVKTQTFKIVSEYGSKFAVTGEGTVLVWYRYGKVDPATFETVMSYALEQNDYILVDGLLHSLSIQEVISFVLQNPSVQEMMMKGLDWQLNKLGFKDFLAYINGGRYDVRHLALFLTIASYLFPEVFQYSGIPQYNGKPLQVYIMYLMYLSDFGQVVTTQLSYLSEQSLYHQSEIDVLFEQTAFLSEQSYYHEEQIEALSSEVSYLSEQSVYQQSEIESLSEMVETQSAEIAVLFMENYIMQSEIDNLSEEIVSEQSEITALSEYVSECCSNVLIQLGQVLTDLLKITGVLGYLIDALGSEGLISSSEFNVLDTVLNSVVGDVSEAVNGLETIVSEVLPLGQILNGITNLISNILPILKVSINVNSSVSSENNSNGGLLGGLLGSLL